MQIIKHSKNINREITNEELEKLDLEPNMESLSDKELEDIFNDRV